jgi:hypothetical protein
MTDHPDRTPLEVGPDGIRRSVETERRLNAATLATFNTDAGKELLEYLRSLTLNRVNGPEISDAALRHHEGMRFLFMVLAARIDRGLKQ